jgi:hypothetical protein
MTHCSSYLRVSDIYSTSSVTVCVCVCVCVRTLVYIKRECWDLEFSNMKCLQGVTNFVLVRYARMTFLRALPRDYV